MEYSRIKGLPSLEVQSRWQSSELEALKQIWHDQKESLENTGGYTQFLEKLQREWAIETGIIEGLYHWDRGVTETLIEYGVESSRITEASGLGRNEASGAVALIEDQQQILEGLFAFVKGEWEFSESYIKEMHQVFTRHQESTDARTPDGQDVKIKLLKGAYKKEPNNPLRPEDGSIHKYCPPEFVNDEMEQLVRIYVATEKEDSTLPEVFAAWTHHRFTQIHPFQDGNGRIARALASLVFLRKGLFPLVIRASDREEYIVALEKADKGDILSLVELFAKRQCNLILSALSIQQPVEQSNAITDQIISNAMELLSGQQAVKQEKLTELAQKLHTKARTKVEELQKRLDSSLKKISPPPNFNASFAEVSNGMKNDYYYRKQIHEAAKKHGYFANLNAYKSWIRLLVVTDSLFEVVFSFHGVGHGDRGIMAASYLTFERFHVEEDGKSESSETRLGNPEEFQFNIVEEEKATFARFDTWMTNSLNIALKDWYQTLQ